jgi:hypothetical protein
MKVLVLATVFIAAALAASSGSNAPAILNFQGAPPNPPAPFPALHSGEAGSAGISADYVHATQNVSAFLFSGTENARMNTPASPSQAIVRKTFLHPSSGPALATTSVFPFAASSTSGMIHTASGGASLISQEILKSDFTCCDSSGLITVTPANAPRYGRLIDNFADPQARNMKWTLRWGPSLATPGTSAYVQTSAAVNATGAMVWSVNNVCDGTAGFRWQANCDLAELSRAGDKPNAVYFR